MCAKFGSYCCTFIPNNTSPEGDFTRAMNKLKYLRNELASNAGQNGGDSALTGWLQSIFGLQWGAWLTTVAIIIGVTLLVFCLVVCCVLPCCKSLAVRAVTSQLPQVSLVVDEEGAAEGLITSDGYHYIFLIKTY